MRRRFHLPLASPPHPRRPFQASVLRGGGGGGGAWRSTRASSSVLLVDDTAASGRRLHEREHEDITIRAGGLGQQVLEVFSIGGAEEMGSQWHVQVSCSMEWP